MERKSKLLPISIIIASVIIAIALIINAIPNRYKVVGNRVFDTIKGNYISFQAPNTNDGAIQKDSNTKSIKDPYTAADFISKVDMSKVKILKQSSNLTGLLYTIDFTVQNNDTDTHTIYARATLYDKDKLPIQTEDSTSLSINPGDIKNMQVIYTGKDKTEIKSFDIELFE